MYAVRLDEERVIQGLAIAMILGLLAMAVMPAIMQVDGILVVAYVLNAINDKNLLQVHVQLQRSLIVTGLYTADKISAIVAGWSIVGEHIPT